MSDGTVRTDSGRTAVGEVMKVPMKAPELPEKIPRE